MTFPRLALVALLLSLPTLAEDPPEKPSAKVKEFLGARAVGILAGATRVEVFRVFPERPTEPMGKEVGGYPVTSTGKERDAAFAGRLRDVLFEEKTYDFARAKRCEFEPGVGYRLWKDKEYVDLVICFSCDELEVSDKKPDAKEPHVAHEDCDAARAALVKLAKEAFPDDKEIQGLEEKRK